MKPQFTTKSMLLATAFVAMWLGGAMPLFHEVRYPGQLRQVCISLLGVGSLWFPCVFAAYSFGRRALTWKTLLGLAAAQLVSFIFLYVHVQGWYY